MRNLTARQARQMAAQRKRYGAGSGRPRARDRCRCGAMTLARAAKRRHNC
jgi:hypothetical protein